MRHETRGARRERSRKIDNRAPYEGVERAWKRGAIETCSYGRELERSLSRYVARQEKPRFDESGACVIKSGGQPSAFRATLPRAMSVARIGIARDSFTLPAVRLPSCPRRRISPAPSAFSTNNVPKTGCVNVTSWAACSRPSSVADCTSDRTETSRASCLAPRASCLLL